MPCDFVHILYSRAYNILDCKSGSTKEIELNFALVSGIYRFHYLKIHFTWHKKCRIRRVSVYLGFDVDRFLVYLRFGVDRFWVYSGSCCRQDFGLFEVWCKQVFGLFGVHCKQVFGLFGIRFRQIFYLFGVRCRQVFGFFGVGSERFYCNLCLKFHTIEKTIQRIPFLQYR